MNVVFVYSLLNFFFRAHIFALTEPVGVFVVVVLQVILNYVSLIGAKCVRKYLLFLVVLRYKRYIQIFCSFICETYASISSVNSTVNSANKAL